MNCVWESDSESEANGCREDEKPEGERACLEPQPCAKDFNAVPGDQYVVVPVGRSKLLMFVLFYFLGTTAHDCRDLSKYCGLVKSFKMCHQPKYQIKCCQTCN